MYFIRHGQSEYNEREKIAGHTDTPLTEKGKVQAREVIPHLPKDCSEIYCSDLIRCKETCEIINKDLQLPIIYDARLRERSFGSLEGKHWKDFDSDGVMEQKDRSFMQYDYRPYGGESVDDVRTRVVAALSDIRAKLKGNNVLVVTSGGVIRLVTYLMKGIIIEDIANSSVSEFDFPDV